jgi:hypothetical protein
MRSARRLPHHRAPQGQALRAPTGLPRACGALRLACAKLVPAPPVLRFARGGSLLGTRLHRPHHPPPRPPAPHQHLPLRRRGTTAPPLSRLAHQTARRRPRPTHTLLSPHPTSPTYFGSAARARVFVGQPTPLPRPSPARSGAGAAATLAWGVASYAGWAQGGGQGVRGGVGAAGVSAAPAAAAAAAAAAPPLGPIGAAPGAFVSTHRSLCRIVTGRWAARGAVGRHAIGPGARLARPESHAAAQAGVPAAG